MVTVKYRVSSLILVALIVATNVITSRLESEVSATYEDQNLVSNDDLDPPPSHLDYPVNLIQVEDPSNLVYGLRMIEVEEVEEEVETTSDLNIVDVLPACEIGATFYSYMDYGMLSKSSVQSTYVRSPEAYTSDDGLRYHGEYLLVALAQVYGPIGTKYRVTFSNDDQILVMKGDEKSSAQTNCTHGSGNSRSLVEVIIDDDVMSSYWLGEGTLHNLLFKDSVKGTVYPVEFEMIGD